MRIENVTLNGYRQYAKCVFSFPAGDSNDIHIVRGRNGRGKTNLMNAVEWCLYGEEFHLSAKYGLQDLLHDPPDGFPRPPFVQVDVELSWTDDARQLRFGKFSRRLDSDDRLTFIENNESGTKIYQGHDAEKKVEFFIPQGMKDNYFFDGEQLSDYFNNNDASAIRNALFKLSGIRTLDVVSEHLDDLRTELQRKAGSRSPDIKALSDRSDMLHAQLSEAKTTLESLRTDQKATREGLDRIDKDLRGLPDVAELGAEREALEQKLVNLKGDFERTRMERDALVCRLFTVTAVLDALMTFQEVLLDKQVKHEIPPAIDPSVVDQILTKDHKCICSTVVEEGTVQFKELTRLLERLKSKSVLGDIVNAEVQSAVPAMVAAAEARVALLTRYRTDLARTSDEIGEVSRQLNDIKDKLIGLKVEHIEDLEHQRSRLRQKLESDAAGIERETALVERTQSDIETVEDEIAAATRKRAATAASYLRIGVVDRAQKAVLGAREERLGQIRSAVESDFQTRFGQLMWKTESFSGVCLDSDYGVHVLDKHRKDMIGSLSKAETQGAAIAFTLALHTVSGYDGPLMIDTPFARTEGDIRGNMARMLLQLSASKQVILLVTKNEYTDEVSVPFKGHLASMVELTQGDYEKETRIQEITT